MKILIIEDDRHLAEAMADFLEMKGAECDFAYNGQSGLRLALERAADVIILDVNLPKMDGHEVCRRLREARVSVPVLMLTACDTTEDQLAGFRHGVDDYVIKPYPMPLIWARLQALLLRNRPQEQIVIGDLVVDLERQEASRAGQRLSLSPIGWKLLAFLASQSPRLVSRREIEAHIWQEDEVDAGNLNVQLSKLRRVLDKPFDSPLLHTKINAGVQLMQRGL